jgi:hypothetical protein
MITACVTLYRLARLGQDFCVRARRQSTMNETTRCTNVHDRIDYVLTESRVMLPGRRRCWDFSCSCL